MEGLDFRLLRDEDFDEVLDFVMKHYATEEPLTQILKMPENEYVEGITPLIQESLRRGVSLGAYDSTTNNMCGLRLNMLGKYETSVSDPDDGFEKLSLPMRQFYTILQHFLGDDLSATVGTKDYLQLFIVTVKKEYCKRGIATELYRRSEALAKQNGCCIMVVMTSSAYTLKATRNLEFKPMKTVAYSDYVDPISGEKILKDIPKPHQYMSLLTKNPS